MNKFEQMLLRFKDDNLLLSKLQTEYWDRQDNINNMTNAFNNYYEAYDKHFEAYSKIWDTTEGKKAKDIGPIETPDGIARIYMTMEMTFTKEYAYNKELSEIMEEAQKQYCIASKGRILARRISEKYIKEQKEYNETIHNKINDLRISINILEENILDEVKTNKKIYNFIRIVALIFIFIVLIKYLAPMLCL